MTVRQKLLVYKLTSRQNQLLKKMKEEMGGVGVGVGGRSRQEKNRKRRTIRSVFKLTVFSFCTRINKKR